MSSFNSSTAALAMNSDTISLQPLTHLQRLYQHLLLQHEEDLSGSFLLVQCSTPIQHWPLQRKKMRNTLPMSLTLPCTDAMQEVEFLIFKYQSIVQELLQRHAVEYAAT